MAGRLHPPPGLVEVTGVGCVHQPGAGIPERPGQDRAQSEYNASLPRASRPQRQLRVRVVVHAGEVHYDANGCFGEALDIAFRLLDAAHVKKALKAAADPLILVVSGDIYRSVVRHGYDGIDQHAFHSFVRVHVAGNRHTGWIHLPEEATQHNVAEIANYRQPALRSMLRVAADRGLPPVTDFSEPGHGERDKLGEAAP